MARPKLIHNPDPLVRSTVRDSRKLKTELEAFCTEYGLDEAEVRRVSLAQFLAKTKGVNTDAPSH